MLRLVHHAVLAVVVLALAPSVALAQSAKAGVVTTLEGNVTVTRVALPPQPLKFKDDVFVNDKVVTGDQSIARMLLGGKAVVTVRERSSLTITEVPGKTTIDLATGKIALAVAKEKMRPGDSLEIRAANAVAGVRGTVVVAEVVTSSAQLGAATGPIGVIWVLSGQVQAYLATQPGNVLLVNRLQQFRGGNVSNILPSQMPQILNGLSLSLASLPHTQDQTPENGAKAGLELANVPFTGVGGVGDNVVAPSPPVNMVAPILPGNSQISPPQLPPLAPPRPSPQPCSSLPCPGLPRR
jgi:hypothetical protein